MDNSTVHFMISSPMVFPKILPDVLSFLRHSCWIVPQSLLALMPSSFTRNLFLNVHLFWVPCTTLSFPGPWWPCPLHSAGMARQVISLWVAVNFQDPSFP
jgi:hypothetical protein